MKSYGRAPTFLMLTGYEQVRRWCSAGRGLEGARQVELELPKTSVCNGPAASDAAACCGAGSPLIEIGA